MAHGLVVAPLTNEEQHYRDSFRQPAGSGAGGPMAAIMNDPTRTGGFLDMEAHREHPETPERVVRPQSVRPGSFGGQSYDQAPELDPIVQRAQTTKDTA